MDVSTRASLVRGLPRLNDGASVLGRLYRSPGFVLATVQTGLFLLTFLLAGGAGLVIVRRAEVLAAHAEIEELEDDFTDRLTHLGLAGAIAHFDSEHRDRIHDYRVQDAAGRVLGGGLAAPPPPPPGKRKYWTRFVPPSRGDVLAYVHDEPGGLTVAVGEHMEVRAGQDDRLLLAILLAAGGVTGAGMLIGGFVSVRVQRRIAAMAAVVERFGSGDRSARLLVRTPARSDLDDLSGALNLMMDRENRLVDGIRQVSWAIAHDLRRPLARHNQEIATALSGSQTAEDYRRALLAASARVTEVLETFQALLHIAELEAGAPGLELVAVDLDALAGRMVEAYLPAAETGGRRLSFTGAAQPVLVRAEPRVLGRVVANLIDNALTYTPVGARVSVAVGAGADGPTLTVADNGPGVPAADINRIFERFVRLDPSRSGEGAGLGLALAAAAVRAFGGRLYAENAEPGLRVIGRFVPVAP